MMRLILLSLCLAALPAFSQEGEAVIPKPMPVDESPTAFACTLERALSSQKTCAFEGKPGEAGPGENARLAAAAAEQACAAAHDDGPLRKDCVARAARAGAECNTRARIVDDAGLVTPEGAACVSRLRREVQRGEARSALAVQCCDCLAGSGCAVPGLQCKNELSLLTPGSALKACLKKSCPAQCGGKNEPAVQEDDAPPPPAKPSRI